MKRLPFFVLLLIVLGTGTYLFWPDPQSTDSPTLHVNTPETAIDLFPNRPKVSEAETELVREYLDWTLKSQPYESHTPTNGETASWLTLYGVSSGRIDQAEIKFPTGAEIQVDVVHVYFLTRSREVLVLPVLIGFETPGGIYTYLSDGLLSESGLDFAVSTSLSRALAHEDAARRLARGAQVRLTATMMVSPNNLVWEACPAYAVEFRRLPAEFCDLGELLESEHAGFTQLLILKAVDSISPDWLMTGWFYFTPDVPPLTLPPLPEPIK